MRAFVVALRRKEKKNYVGRETLPTSIKEKEIHWLKELRVPSTARSETEIANGDLEGFWKHLALEPGY
eukprot:1137659-Pelagomonas_calceolata.AAC.4